MNPGGTGPGQRWMDAMPAHWAISLHGQRKTSDKYMDAKHVKLIRVKSQGILKVSDIISILVPVGGASV